MDTKDDMTMAQRQENLKAELRTIKNRNNAKRLTPDDVVQFATDPDTALHACFEWDDSVAGHRYRITQARNLISRITINVTNDFRKIESVYYVRDPTSAPSEQGYISIDDLRTDAELARDALINEFVQVRALLSRARNLALVLGIEEEIIALQNDVDTISTKLQATTSPVSHAMHAQ